MKMSIRVNCASALDYNRIGNTLQTEFGASLRFRLVLIRVYLHVPQETHTLCIFPHVVCFKVLSAAFDRSIVNTFSLKYRLEYTQNKHSQR